MERQNCAIVIPVSVLALGLPPAESMILSKIVALCKRTGGCYASNGYIAQACFCSERTVSRIISNLKARGLIEQISFDGRRRMIRVLLSVGREQVPLLNDAAALTERRGSPDRSSGLPRQKGDQDKEKEKEKEKETEKEQERRRFPSFPARENGSDGSASRHRRGRAEEFVTFDVDELFALAKKRSAEAASAART